MGIASDIAEDWHAALAALSWQVDAGVDEVLGDAPLNRYDLPAEAPKAASAVVAPAVAAASRADPAPLAAAPEGDAVQAAKAAAAAALTLDALRDAIAAYPHCELKKGARSTVFADGNPKARVLVLGEASGPGGRP